MQARSGSFHQQLSVPLVSALLEGGLVFVLRWALDDSMESSMVASVTALHALLVCQQDEVRDTIWGHTTNITQGLDSV